MIKRAVLLAAVVGLLPSLVLAQQKNNPVNCATSGDGNFVASTFNWGTGISYLDCVGAFSGNDGGSPSNNQESLVNSTWEGVYGEFSLKGSSADAGNGPFTSLNGGPLGFDVPLSGYFALTLKQASFFSIYLFRADSPVSFINWDSRGVAENGGTNNPDKLSHAVLYTQQVGYSQVPEPSTYLLLGAGLFGLAGAAFKRRKD